MIRAIQCITCAALLVVGAQSWAEDAQPKDTDSSAMMKKKDEMMKSCMRDEKKTMPNMSEADMKKACEDKMMKMQKEHDSMKQKPAS